jgi:NAD(P)-dependent dehydrogenase (short-subunit alcohol dehydrogenase family)
MLLENKVAIVTGGSSCLGLAITRSIVAHGGKVVVGDIDEAAGAKLAAELRGVVFVRCDVGSPDDNDALVHKALETFGALDIAVNNAGISGPIKRLVETDFAAWKSCTVSGSRWSIALAELAVHEGGSERLIRKRPQMTP